MAIISLLATLLMMMMMVTVGGGFVRPESAEDFVVTLDHSNFTNFVGSHDFIVVEFFAPWCGHSQRLAPEYEKAASILSKHDPPIVLAKVDASEETNHGLALEHNVNGFPTIKILRGGGKTSQEYKGPREADGIVDYLKGQLGPATVELKSVEDVISHMDEKKISIVGVFPRFSGEEFENFTKLAERLRSDYAFGHALDARILPKGGSDVHGPTIRLLKPFDELFVDFKGFDLDEVEKFIEANSMPSLTVYNDDPINHPYLIKYFNNDNAKAMLFVDFSADYFAAYKSKFQDIATLFNGNGTSFLIGDLEDHGGLLEYFGIDKDQAPLIMIIQQTDDQKFLKANLQLDQIVPWFKAYLVGKLNPFKKSQPVPEVNDEPVKVVVADSLNDMVLNSQKNVLLEFYAPWCGHCKQLAPILDEVAVHFKDDSTIMIAKLDATANDFPSDTFKVMGFPTMYFKSSSGRIVQYDGSRAKEAIIEFIARNKDIDPNSEVFMPTEEGSLDAPDEHERVNLGSPESDEHSAKDEL